MLLNGDVVDITTSFPLDQSLTFKYSSVTMARVLFFLALIVAAASAFVAPAQNAGKLPRFRPDMRCRLTRGVIAVVPFVA